MTNIDILTDVGVKGARMFNLLPAEVRNIDADNVDKFKKCLDDFFCQVPDQPTILGWEVYPT